MDRFSKESALIQDIYTERYKEGNLISSNATVDQESITIPQAVRMAYTLFGNNKLNDVVLICNQLITHNENNVDANNLLGLTALVRGDSHQAIPYLQKVTMLSPGFSQAYCNLGKALFDVGRTADSIDRYRRAIQLDPGFGQAYSNLSDVYRSLGELDNARDCAETAISIMPDNAEAHNNLGNVMKDKGLLDQAIDCYQKAHGGRPNSPEIVCNLGTVLHFVGRDEEAIEAYRSAIQLAPDYAAAHYYLGLVLLSQKKLKQGWSEFEWRIKDKTIANHWQISGACWDGSSLDGKTILLVGEQGLGDTIQFIRCGMQLRKSYDCRVICLCAKQIQTVVQSCPAVDAVFSRVEDLPAYDMFSWVMSLPGILQLGLTDRGLDALRDDVPYLSAGRGQVESLTDLFPPCKGLRIGLHWQGNRKFSRDGVRSFALAEMHRLALCEGVDFVSLQKGEASQLEECAGSGFDVREIGVNGTEWDMMDTAAAIEHLDLVITSDSAVAHLAGAMGLPVWLALGAQADWRWFDVGSAGANQYECPWYPSMRIFRQQEPGDWCGVFSAMAKALEDTDKSIW